MKNATNDRPQHLIDLQQHLPTAVGEIFQEGLEAFRSVAISGYLTKPNRNVIDFIWVRVANQN